MLTTEDFEIWCQQLHLAPETRTLLATLRTAPPVRKVRGRASTVTGRYPSPKMGRTIQFESQHVELWAIYAMERDDDVLEYYDQPTRLPLHYRAPSGRMTTQWHTPDFLVLRRGSVGFEEWKAASMLESLTASMPARYQRDDQGTWRCPPGEVAARTLGLAYHVRSSGIFHPRYIQNVRFLQDFWSAPPAVAEADAARVVQFVATTPGIRLDALLRALPTLTVDVIWTLIATHRVFTALTATSLMHHDRVALYGTAAAVPPADTVTAQRTPPTDPVLVQWDQRLWHAEPEGDTIVLRPEVGAPFTLTRRVYQAMVDGGTLRPITAATPTPTSAAIRETLVRAGPTAHETANQRLAQILAAGRGDPTTASARSLQRWRAAYRQAEAQHGCGYLGLLGRVADRGNRTQRAAETSLALLETCLREEYAAPHAPTAAAIYRRYQKACTDQGLHPISERTFYRVRARMMTPEMVTARSGRRIAYATEPFVWSLEQTTPRHGERPLAIAHLDHTELDILLVSSVTGKPFARPWLTLLTDAYSRRILALYLTYDPPSYRSAMMIFRVCVQRFGRLPQDLVVDGGKEFGSVAFETLLARYFVTKKERPAGQPRFGSLIERLFGTTTTEFLYQLRGNTQATKQVRTMTPAVDPQAHAVWTLERLAARLSEWAYDIYDQRAHPALGLSPRAAFIQGMAHAGLREHRMIPYSNEFIMVTRPPTRTGQAKIHPARGITVHWLHYWHEVMRSPQIAGTTVPVRYEPYDMGVVYAFIAGQWHECVADAFAQVHGRSEREWHFILDEWRQQQHQHGKTRLNVNGPQLAAFLESVAAEERVLLQRQRDLEAMPLRAAIVGGRTAPLVGASEVPSLPAPMTDDLDLSSIPQYEEYC